KRHDVVQQADPVPDRVRGLHPHRFQRPANPARQYPPLPVPARARRAAQPFHQLRVTRVTRETAPTMTFRAAALALAVLLAPLAAPAQGLRPATPLLPPARLDSGPQAADYIVAVVNSEPITNNDVRARMARFQQQLAEQGQQPPPRDEFVRQVLERLINERAQIQFARENGVKIDEALVDQAEQHVARTSQ